MFFFRFLHFSFRFYIDLVPLSTSPLFRFVRSAFFSRARSVIFPGSEPGSPDGLSGAFVIGRVYPSTYHVAWGARNPGD